MPYRSGPPPEGAIVHIYETRCLPGDEGRNPYVLGSCGSNGYPLPGGRHLADLVHRERAD